MDKRGVSQVIAVVMLISITVIAAVLIMSFLVPFIKNELNQNKECFNLIDAIEFSETQFNCYDEINHGIYRTSFSVKVNKGIEGFKISLIDENGNSRVYDIKNEKVIQEIGMYLGFQSVLGGQLEVPNIGGQKTYFSEGRYVEAEIAPIINSFSCSITDKIKFNGCTGVNLE